MSEFEDINQPLFFRTFFFPSSSFFTFTIYCLDFYLSIGITLPRTWNPYEPTPLTLNGRYPSWTLFSFD
jgi:hypothetical protein